MINLKQPQTMEARRLLRPQTRIDLILEMDYLTAQADIRSSMILNNTSQEIIVAQTQPPIGKSSIGREVEASVVHHSAVQSSRWGWKATIQGLDNRHKLNPDDPSSKVVQAVFLSRPGRRTELTKSNVRQAYRLEAYQRFGITVTVKPMPAPISLLNFSAGGIMLNTPKASAFTLGQELDIELIFPDKAPLPLHHIQGQAVIVRLELDDHNHRSARIGLKFLNLNLETHRALPKIINHYMLEEQRIRNREEDGF